MKPRENWMSPLNRIIWLNSFRKRMTRVVLRDGRRFSVDYDQIPGKAYVNIMPNQGETIPCGWFELSRVTSDQFLYEQDARWSNV
jgi:hypothetical protein